MVGPRISEDQLGVEATAGVGAWIGACAPAVAVATSSMVQPGVALTTSLDIADLTENRRFVSKLDAALRAVGLTVIEIVVQQVVDNMMAGILTGAAAGASSLPTSRPRVRWGR